MTNPRSPAEPTSPNKTARWLLPPAASIAVHAGLLVALTAVTIEVTREREPPRPQRVSLTGSTARPQPETNPTPDDTAASDPTAANATPSPAEPAALTDALDTTAGPAPVVAPAPIAPAPLAESILSPDNAGVPRVRFAEIDAAPARTVVFVVDASGAVATAFTFVREELLRSIDQLSPTQRFQVVVFPGPENSAPRLAPINDGRLAHASPAAKRAVAEWMTTFRPRGRSAPLAGLRKALALEPDIALLITRSIERTGPDAAWGAGLKETLEELDTLNPIEPGTNQRRTAIAAVQLLDEDPTGTMPAIAAIHGSGITDYRVVSAETLASPRNPRPRATGATNTNTIDAAAAILADLDDTGTALRIFQGLPDSTDHTNARDKAARAAQLAARTPDDPRARVLLARARSFSPERSRVIAALDTLRAELLHDPDADAWRRLAIVDILAGLGRFDHAREELNALGTDAAEMPISRSVRMRIATTAAALGHEPPDLNEALQSDPFADDAGMTDPYWILALTEASTRGRLRAERSDVFQPLADLLDRAEREGADAWPPILIDRFVRAAAMSPGSLETAPARVRLEVAAVWARTPNTRAQAGVVLRSLIAQETPHRPEALWQLAVIERSADTAESRARAADHLAELSHAYPDHPRAPDALAGAIALTTDPARLRPLLIIGVERLPDRPETDLWRLQLAGLLTGGQILDTLEPIAPGTRESTLARERFRAAADELLRSLDEPDRPALLERTGVFLARHADPAAADWLTRAADAVLGTDPKRAITLATQAAEIALEPSTAELVLARAYIAVHQPARATPVLSKVATRLDAAADRSETFWHAWTLLLETAGDDDPDAARAHLARLALTDPDLGGEPWRTRLTILSDRLRTP